MNVYESSDHNTESVPINGFHEIKHHSLSSSEVSRCDEVQDCCLGI